MSDFYQQCFHVWSKRNPDKVGVCEVLTRLNWLYKFKERFQKAAEIFNSESIPHNKNCMHVSLIESVIR